MLDRLALIASSTLNDTSFSSPAGGVATAPASYIGGFWDADRGLSARYCRAFGCRSRRGVRVPSTLALRSLRLAGPAIGSKTGAAGSLKPRLSEIGVCGPLGSTPRDIGRQRQFRSKC